MRETVFDHPPKTVQQATQASANRLLAAGIDTAISESQQFLAALLGVSLTTLILRRSERLSLAQWQTLKAWLERRAAGEPLQHILGYAYFYGLKLRVTPEVLIPRPETEVLVAEALGWLKNVRNPRVIDIGTGSGAIALAIKAERPDAVVTASDISQSALNVARDNAQVLGLAVHFVRSDLLAEQRLAREVTRCNVLLSNPPYLPEADAGRLSREVQRDPASALFSGADGLCHARALLEQAHALMPARSKVGLELDPRNIRRAYNSAAPWQARNILKDLAGRERFLLLTR